MMKHLASLSNNNNIKCLPLDNAAEAGALPQSFPGSQKIRSFYLFKIRYCYSSQVDPEFSGWLNTVAAFFVFHISHFFSSTFLGFSLYLSHHIIHNHTDTCSQFVTLLPEFSSLSCFSSPTYTSTHTHSRKHTQPVSRQL